MKRKIEMHLSYGETLHGHALRSWLKVEDIDGVEYEKHTICTDIDIKYIKEMRELHREILFRWLIKLDIWES